MKFAAAAAAGLASTLAFPSVGLWPLVVLGPAVLVALWTVSSPRQAALLGGVFGFVHFVTGLWWIYVSTHIYGGAPAWLAVLLVLVLCGYLALYPALAGYLAVRAARDSTVLLALVFAPLAWLLSELLRGWMLTGFAWLGLGYALAEAPLAARWVPLFGVHGLGAMALILAGALVLIAQRRAFSGLAALLVVLGLSAVLPAAGSWTKAAGSTLDLALVQGNVGQGLKWRPEQRWPTMEKYRRLTESAWDADLIIWPEVAVPAAMQDVRPWFDELERDAKFHGTTVLVGAISRENGAAYNTMFALGVEPGRYTKRHLVPFGEYFPVPALLLDLLDLPYGNISTDRPAEPALTARGHVLGLSICFEDVFPDEVRRAARSTGLLVNVTNDAWFAGTPAPLQHLQIARLRALETGRPLARVANTGVSTLLHADGRVDEGLGWEKTGVLRVQVSPVRGQTPFMRWGHAPLFGLIGLATAFGLWRQRSAFS